MKLDADLTFDTDYFEKCFEHFRQDPELGIGGGEIRHDIAGEMKAEKNPSFHVRGATKIYRQSVLGGDRGPLVGFGLGHDR